VILLTPRLNSAENHNSQTQTQRSSFIPAQRDALGYLPKRHWEALKARFIGDNRQAIGLRLIEIASDAGRCPELV
jgi:hypothetical protein